MSREVGAHTGRDTARGQPGGTQGSGEAVGRSLEERGMIPRSGVLVVQAGWGPPRYRTRVQAQTTHERNNKVRKPAEGPWNSLGAPRAGCCYLKVPLTMGGAQAGPPSTDLGPWPGLGATGRERREIRESPPERQQTPHPRPGVAVPRWRRKRLQSSSDVEAGQGPRRGDSPASRQTICGFTKEEKKTPRFGKLQANKLEADLQKQYKPPRVDQGSVTRPKKIEGR